MKIEFDTNTIFRRYADSYSKKLDKGLEITKIMIDEGTPELTGDLKAHNKIQMATLQNNKVIGSVYNDLGDYELKVEKDMGFVANFHKYELGGTRRYIFTSGIGAFMFRDGFAASVDILMDYLREG